MNTQGFLATWNGMLNVASRRDAPPTAEPASRRTRRGIAARLLRRD